MGGLEFCFGHELVKNLKSSKIFYNTCMVGNCALMKKALLMPDFDLIMIKGLAIAIYCEQDEIVNYLAPRVDNYKFVKKFKNSINKQDYDTICRYAIMSDNKLLVKIIVYTEPQINLDSAANLSIMEKKYSIAKFIKKHFGRC